MKKKRPPQIQPSYSISGCNISAHGAPVSDAAAKVAETLALGIIRNAEAIIEVAKTLKGSDAKIETGIHIGAKP